MHSQMLTSRLGAELISYKLDGIEKIHQGQDCIDENGRVYWKRHFPVLFPIVGKLKQNKTFINGRTYEMGQHGFARDMEFEPVTKLDNFHSYVLKSNPSTFVKYPFDFSLYVTYRTDENKLTTRIHEKSFSVYMWSWKRKNLSGLQRGYLSLPVVSRSRR